MAGFSNLFKGRMVQRVEVATQRVRHLALEDFAVAFDDDTFTVVYRHMDEFSFSCTFHGVSTVYSPFEIRMTPGAIKHNDASGLDKEDSVGSALSSWVLRVGATLEQTPEMRAIQEIADRQAEVEEALKDIPDRYATKEEAAEIREHLRDLEERLSATTRDGNRSGRGLRYGSRHANAIA